MASKRKISSGGDEQSLSEIKKLSGHINNIESLFNSLPFAIISVDKKGVVQNLNQKAEDVIAVDREAALGDTLTEIIQLTDTDTGLELKFKKKLFAQLERPTEFDDKIFVSDTESKYRIDIHNRLTEGGKIDGSVIILQQIDDSYDDSIAYKEKQYQTLIETMSEGVALHEIIYDKRKNPVDYRVLDVNLAFERILKLRSEDVLGKLSTEIYKTDAPPFLETYAKVAHTGKPTKFEIYFTPMDKFFSISSFSPGKGKFATVFSDITHKKQMEQALKQSEQMFNRAFHGGPLIMAICDIENGRFLEVNSNFLKSTEFSREEVIGSNAVELGIVTQEVFETIDKDIKQNGKIDALEVTLEKKSGEKMICLFFAELITISGIERMFAICKDITDSKMVETELHKSRERLRMTLLSIGDAVISTDLDGKIMAMNPVAESLTGYTFEEAKGDRIDKIFDIVSTKTNKKAEDPVAKVLKSGKIVGLANHTALKSKDGAVYQISDSAAPIKDKNGNVVGVVLVFRDITQEYKMRETIRQNEMRYRATLSAIPDILFRINKRMIFVDCHVHNSDKLLVPEKDFLGKKVGEVLPAQLAKLTEDMIKKTLEKGELITYKYDLELDAEVRFFEARMVPHGKEEVLAIVRDITDVKKQEEAIELVNQRNQALLNAMPEMMFVLDSNGNYIDFKADRDEKLAIDKDEIIGMNIKDAGFTDEQLEFILNEIAKTIKTGKKTSFEYELETPSGHGVFHAIMVPFDGDKILATVRDVTDRIELQNELIKMQKLESIGNLAGGIAHDFNNILLGLFGNLSIAKELIDDDHPAQEYIQQSEKAFKMAKRMTMQLLTFSKGGQPVLENIDLEKIVKDIVEFDLSGSMVKPAFEFEENLWSAKADKAQLQQVFSNLTLNARDAMPDGGVFTVRISNKELSSGHKHGLPEGNYIHIEMSDTGIGIPKSNLDKIFDPYFSTKTGEGGLGLATVISVIKKHNGDISVSSKPGKGTTFSILIPATTGKQAVDSAVTARGEGFENMKALVMDDNESVRNVTKYRLEKMGFEAITANCGKEAIRVFKEEHKKGEGFDVVIMDLTVPGGKGGMQSIEEVLSIDPDAKVIISSGYADDDVISNFKDYGFKDIIAKPYTKEQLRAVLEKVIHNS